MVVSRTPGKEPSQDYTRGGYHPVNVGEVYRDRYAVVQQLGWGRYSTVWLVKDFEKNREAAMKVLKSNATEDTTGGDECDILRALRDTNPKAPGYRHICHLIDDFVHEGPNGPHICIVTELMGPTVMDCYRCVPGAMPLHFVKRLAKQMLLALQYVHDECHLVHTDIKGDNIFMRGAPPPPHPLAQKFEEEELMTASFKLGDFGTANRLSNRHASLIQPEALRAPEVILDAEWDTRADIWNLGALIYEFARGKTLFDPHKDLEKTGLSPEQTHISQMVALLGDFPNSLLHKGRNVHLYFDENSRLLGDAGGQSKTLEGLLAESGHYEGDVAATADFLTR
ncbi:hypothetical protein PHLGIDRAFT_111026, partial [Phlebiopsis gigantea 11061_1 CR5-6]